MAIACAGYRVASVPGHHHLNFDRARLACGKSAANLSDHFDAFRRKRNETDYTGPTFAAGTQTKELPLHVRSFLELAEQRI
jgi:hypothetical protein